MKSKNSIKKQLTITFAVAAGVIVLLAFSVVGMLVQSNITKLKTDAAYRLIDDASESISTQIDTMFATAYTIASDVTVCNPALTFEQKLPTLQKYAADRKINSIGYITGEGYLTSTDGFENDISTRQYFIDMMAGGKYISNPSFNTATQSQIIFIGVPLYYDNKIVAAMTLTFDSSYMSNIISNITYDGLGEAYMLSTTGTYIASNNIDDVLDKKNNIDAAAEDASLQPIADLEQKMISTPEGEETFNGTTYFYNKIANSDGWTLIFKIPSAAFSKEMSTIWTIFVVCEVCVLALIIALSIVIGSNLGNRLLKLESYISKVSDGDFSVKLDSNELNKADEIGMIYKALDKTISDVGNAISSIKAYTVELSSQADSLESTSDTLNNGTSTVVRAMNEIQTGNSEQAREIENINNEMANFNENVKTVNDSVEEVVGITNTAAHQLTDGNKEMALLKESFNKFNDFFASFAVEINAMNDNLSSVSMITSTISDIAEETNLLSLNASIEAARAGEAGRGFAVVAQEIAKLAQQSADSVGEISNVVSTITTSSKNLIETSAVMGDQIKSQDTIIDSTLTSFEDLTQKMKDMLPAIENISKISKDNLMMARNIGDSISNANSISEELVATTSEVSATSRRFSESSDNVNVASNSINDLSANLNQLANKFTC